MPETSAQQPTTLTISVFTRHSAECPKRDDPQWKKCDCRKSVYIYDGGKRRYESAKTRNWKKAEEYARALLDARDPQKIAVQKLQRERERVRAEAEAAKAAEEAAKAQALSARITLQEALRKWLLGLRLDEGSRSRRVQFNSLANKLESWAAAQGIKYLADITADMLYSWQGTWKPDAQEKRDRMGPATRNLYISHLHRFFRWAIEAEHITKDPSRIVKRKKYERIQTKPLTSPEQFEQIIVATYTLDADKYQLRYVPDYGRDLRAIFQLQRWTGLRLIDALMMKRSSIRDGLMTIKTKKTGKEIKNRPLPKQVLDALGAIPVQDHVRDGYYFWSKDCDDEDNLTIVWSDRISKLNKYLSLNDEEGKPMEFRSHMLRDTFAVELLMHDVPLERVSFLLTHDSVKMTEQYYAPWIEKRRKQAHDEMVAALAKMGATFDTPIELVGIA